MEFAIHFDDQPCGMNGKVGDVGTDRNLFPDMRAMDFPKFRSASHNLFSPSVIERRSFLALAIEDFSMAVGAKKLSHFFAF